MIGVVAIPLGLWVFRRGELYAKQAREAEAVGMIAVRPVESDADLEAWIRVRRAVLPNESTGTVEQVRARMKPEQLFLVAELDGELAGSGIAGLRTRPAGRSSLRGCCRRPGASASGGSCCGASAGMRPASASTASGRR